MRFHVFGQFENANVAVFITDVDFAINKEGRSPARSEHVVGPVWLSCLNIEAMKKPTKICNKKQAIFNRNCTAGAVHGFLKTELAISVGVKSWVVPDSCRVGVGACLPLRSSLIDGLEATMR